jgi:hypothetical protein
MEVINHNSFKGHETLLGSFIEISAYTNNTAVQDGYNNLCIGHNSGYSGLHTIWNILIGKDSGYSYNNSETNILIIGDSNNGIAGESDTIKIGSTQSQFSAQSIYDNMSSTRDNRAVFIDSDSKLYTTFSGNVVLMGEIYYENPVSDTRTLLVGVATPIEV